MRALQPRVSAGRWRALPLALAVSLLSVLPAHAQSTASVVNQGHWEEIDYAVKGRWRIVYDGTQYRVELGEDFETKDGPDLHILLSKERLDRITNENATQRALIVGLLKTTDDSTFFRKMKGAQSLPIAPGTDISAYRTILIHCVKYSHLWAGSPLE